MSVTISQPGYYVVRGTPTKALAGNVANEAAGIVHFTSAGTLPNDSSATLITTAANLTDVNESILNNAIAESGATWLFEAPGGVSKIVSDVESTGKAVFQPSQAGIRPTNDIAFAALLAAAPIAASVAGSVAAGGVAAGGAGLSAGESAAGGGAAGGLASKASSIASKLTSGLGSDAKTALTGAAIGSILLDPGLWKGVALVIAGAVLLLLAARGAMGAGGGIV